MENVFLFVEPESMEEEVLIIAPTEGCYRIGGVGAECDITVGGVSAGSVVALLFVGSGTVAVQAADASDSLFLDGQALSPHYSVLMSAENNLAAGSHLIYTTGELQPGMIAQKLAPGITGQEAAALMKPQGRTERVLPQASRPMHEDTVTFLSRTSGRVKGDDAHEGRFVFPALPLIPHEAQAEVDKFIYGRLKPLFDMLMRETAVKAEEARKAAEDALDGVLRQQEQHMPSSLTFETAKRHAIAAFMEYGPLQALLGDEKITEIMVNGPEDIFIESKGKLVKSHYRFWDQQELRRVIEKMVAVTNRNIDEQQPYQDTRLEDGSRVNVIIRPVALRGDSITIRKFPNKRLYIEDLVNFGAMSGDMAKFLRLIVEHKANIIVSGGTGSGKTTLLNVLSSFIPDGERLVSIEDAAELRLAQPNKVCLESKPKNAEGGRAITIRDLVINALRMRPDRIVVGECRGGETLDMLQAMNTGHEGSLTTLHANTPRDAIGRIETMCLMGGMDLPTKAIRAQVVSAVNFIVQQSRMVDGSRKITSIQEILGLEGEQVVMQEIFKYERLGMDDHGKIKGRFLSTGVVPDFVQSLRENRIEFPLEFFIQESEAS